MKPARALHPSEIPAVRESNAIGVSRRGRRTSSSVKVVALEAAWPQARSRSRVGGGVFHQKNPEQLAKDSDPQCQLARGGARRIAFTRAHRCFCYFPRAGVGTLPGWRGTRHGLWEPWAPALRSDLKTLWKTLGPGPGQGKLGLPCRLQTYV